MKQGNRWYEIVCHGMEENLHKVMNQDFKVKDKNKKRSDQLEPSKNAH